MKNPFKTALFLLVLTCLCLPASAIVVDDYSVATNAPTGSWDINWDYVYKYKNSSAVAVGDHWLLTAAHVADDGGTGTVVVNGTNYLQQEIIFHAATDDPEHSDKADLALVRFDKAFPGTYPLYTGSFPSFPSNSRLDAVLIGYGVTGTVYSTYYRAAPYTDPSKGTKRWGTQRIDGDLTLTYNGDGSVGVTTNIGFKMDFSSSDSDYESGVGTYDSGGGTFVDDGGVWKLAGINTVGYRAYLSTPSDAWDRVFSVSVPAYETWATNVMSEMGDLDDDGIPNYWERQFGATTGVVASADQDGDGMDGEDEYTADTDPTDSNAVWQTAGSFSLTNQTFTFTGSTNRKYQVLHTTNDLADPGLTWISNGVPVWGQGSNTTIAVTNTEDTVFYRVWATLP